MLSGEFNRYAYRLILDEAQIQFHQI